MVRVPNRGFFSFFFLSRVVFPHSVLRVKSGLSLTLSLKMTCLKIVTHSIKKMRILNPVWTSYCKDWWPAYFLPTNHYLLPVLFCLALLPRDLTPSRLHHEAPLLSLFSLDLTNSGHHWGENEVVIFLLSSFFLALTPWFCSWLRVPSNVAPVPVEWPPPWPQVSSGSHYFRPKVRIVSWCAQPNCL